MKLSTTTTTTGSDNQPAKPAPNERSFRKVKKKIDTAERYLLRGNTWAEYYQHCFLRKSAHIVTMITTHKSCFFAQYTTHEYECYQKGTLF